MTFPSQPTPPSKITILNHSTELDPSGFLYHLNISIFKVRIEVVKPSHSHIIDCLAFWHVYLQGSTLEHYLAWGKIRIEDAEPDKAVGAACLATAEALQKLCQGILAIGNGDFRTTYATVGPKKTDG